MEYFHGASLARVCSQLPSLRSAHLWPEKAIWGTMKHGKTIHPNFDGFLNDIYEHSSNVRDFRMIFSRFSHDFPMTFLDFSGFSHDFPMISHDFPGFFHDFP